MYYVVPLPAQRKARGILLCGALEQAFSYIQLYLYCLIFERAHIERDQRRRRRWIKEKKKRGRQGVTGERSVIAAAQRAQRHAHCAGKPGSCPAAMLLNQLEGAVQHQGLVVQDQG
ncbi:unnamed protein product [Gadus morhua 'NCC']